MKNDEQSWNPYSFLSFYSNTNYGCIHLSLRSFLSSNPRPRERTKGVTKRMQWVLADVSRPNTSYSGTSEYRSRKRQHGSPPGG